MPVDGSRGKAPAAAVDIRSRFRSTEGSGGIGGPGNTVIHLRERNFNMLKKDLIFRNPLRIMGNENEDLLKPGGFGAVLARAGVGKTALMVQLALDSLLEGRNVLHISLVDPVRKVCVWYEEVFRNIARQYRIDQMDQLWETILPHRLIMTFTADGFTVPKLEERLSDLAEQDIFLPRMILVDGLPFGEGVREILTELKALGRSYDLKTWFTVRTHRHETPGPDGIPLPLAEVFDLFDVAFELRPEGETIHVERIGGDRKDGPTVCLEPSTMLIRSREEGMKQVL